MTRKRADVYLVEAGIVESREQARRLINEGKVFADGKPVGKPASLIEDGSHITVLEPTTYVSRGGLKLEKALHEFAINPEGKFCVDVGASTGGFTDCLLRHGARRVVAIDVGYGQLAWSLRQNPKVVVMERTNIRYVAPADLEEPADLVTVDASFISLEKILESILNLMKPDGELIALVKPQFEAGRERIGKKGVIKDPEVHKDILMHIWDHFKKSGLFVKGLIYSPIKGPEGNIEFLIYASRIGPGIPEEDKAGIVDNIVEKAHEELS